MRKLNFKILRDFIRSSSAGGIILLFSVLISLGIANSGHANFFNKILAFRLGYENLHLQYSIIHWINDGLMAIFFLLVGLEIKRAVIAGELSSIRKASFPVFAAIGGAIIPALIFWLINKNTSTASGWGIPMATDIAFSMAVISLLRHKVPASLKIFLAALAIVDDLIAILVIAFFYSDGIHWNYLLSGLGIFAAMLVMNRMGVTRLAFYIIPGLFLWYFIHLSGIHATIAGVLMAFAVPMSSKTGDSPLEYLEHALTKPVNFLIIPVFALANTNITFHTEMINGLLSFMSIGIILGLLVGKPIGISLVSWLVVKFNLSTLPHQITWRHVIGVGLLGGIGFTMSIFITLLSFREESLHANAKLAIVLASFVAGVAGYLFLGSSSSKKGS